MTVSLNIQNDEELRAYIKDLVKGQVLSIAREEIVNIINDVVLKKIGRTTSPDTIFQEEITKMVKAELLSTTWSSPSYIKKVAREVVEQQLKDILIKNPIV